MGGAKCKPACTLPARCQQIGSAKQWRCAPPRPSVPPLRRRQPLKGKRQAAASVASAAVGSDDADGEDAEGGPGPAAAVDESGDDGQP